VSVSAALQQIVESDLGPKLKANAAALLQRAHEENGYVCMGWQELGELLGAAPATVQRQLTALHRARIIHYSTNGDGLVYVIFKAWTPAAERVDVENRRKNRQKVSKKSTESVEKIDGFQQHDEEGTPADRQEVSKNSTESVEKIDGFTRHVRGRSVSLLVSLTDPETDKELTNRQTLEQARSYALLTDPDVGIDSQLAREFATDFQFDYLLRHVCVWRSDPKARGPGALINRIRKNFGGRITEADRASPLYRRHVPTEETQAGDEEERRRKYDPTYWEG